MKLGSHAGKYSEYPEDYGSVYDRASA
jgi:hypothetical protein